MLTDDTTRAGMQQNRPQPATAGFAMERRDRPWVDAYVTIVCGPFDMPSIGELRAAVDSVAQRYPASRLSWGFGDAKRSWLPERSIESIVVERDAVHDPDFGIALDRIATDPSLDPPLTLVRYPNHIGMRMSHSLGDGLSFVSVIAAAMLTAVSGEVVPWPTVPAGRFPLLRAGARTFGRNPALMRTAIRDRFQGVDPPGTGTARPWTPSRRTVHRLLPASQVEEIYAWGANHAPRASKFAIQAALFLRALRTVGVTISTDVRVMVDLRDYLGAGLIDGNFFAGVPMPIDTAMTPDQISAVVRSVKASGRPLANQLATSLRLGSPIAPPDTVEDGLRPQITFTYLGVPPQVDWLPYLPGQAPVYAAGVEPGGPYGMTLVHGHCRGGMVLNACFHDNVIDPVAVEAAMDLMGEDPIGLLEQQVAS